MSRTIVYILGTSFSGSSLLNSLLDAQPATRGLGEAVHFLDKPTSAWCSHCRCHVDQCQLQAMVSPARFYENVFGYYPDARVVVNSSKHWGLCFRHMPLPPKEYQIRLVILSKSLEEFAHSYVMHNTCSLDESFTMWVEFYDRLFFHLDCVLARTPRADTHLALAGRLRPEHIGFVTYRELATCTAATVERLCGQWDLPFDANFGLQLWRGDTCTIGGNNAVYAQQTGNEAFFQDRPDYLGGKYIGRHRQIFYDDAWRRNAPLRSAAEAYRRDSGDVMRLESRLGQAMCGEYV
jgi:hypothetical protein